MCKFIWIIYSHTFTSLVHHMTCHGTKAELVTALILFSSFCVVFGSFLFKSEY